MKSVVLLPYYPWPANTGAKVEMWKHLDLLRSMGDCKIVSAEGRPVGAGWTKDALLYMQDKGFEVRLRENSSRYNMRTPFSRSWPGGFPKKTRWLLNRR
jgi:hypothetical protein